MRRRDAPSVASLAVANESLYAMLRQLEPLALRVERGHAEVVDTAAACDDMTADLHRMLSRAEPEHVPAHVVEQLCRTEATLRARVQALQRTRQDESNAYATRAASLSEAIAAVAEAPRESVRAVADKHRRARERSEEERDAAAKLAADRLASVQAQWQGALRDIATKVSTLVSDSDAGAADKAGADALRQLDATLADVETAFADARRASDLRESSFADALEKRLADLDALKKVAVVARTDARRRHVCATALLRMVDARLAAVLDALPTAAADREARHASVAAERQVERTELRARAHDCIAQITGLIVNVGTAFSDTSLPCLPSLSPHVDVAARLEPHANALMALSDPRTPSMLALTAVERPIADLLRRFSELSEAGAAIRDTVQAAERRREEQSARAAAIQARSAELEGLREHVCALRSEMAKLLFVRNTAAMMPPAPRVAHPARAPPKAPDRHHHHHQRQQQKTNLSTLRGRASQTADSGSSDDSDSMFRYMG